MTPALIDKLKQLAEQSCWADKLGDSDSVVEDWAGGNVDDAFEGGVRSGEVQLARELLDELAIPYVSPVDD